jgi:rfaE bifunctional protein nucleotidyltransferase chain/domain
MLLPRSGFGTKPNVAKGYVGEPIFGMPQPEQGCVMQTRPTHGSRSASLRVNPGLKGATATRLFSPEFKFSKELLPFAGHAFTISVSPMSQKKILTRAGLLSERAHLRASGKSLVFTNGVFDILHVGHVRYLAEARALGDALVIAVNSDESARELKGANRPINSESDRAEVLAALEAVTYVTVFSELSPRALIAALLPDVLVKGGDYALDQIHGREEVEAAGGRVVSLPFVEGASTTGIIERMKTIS